MQDLAARDQPLDRRMKIMVLTFRPEDYELLETMLASAREKIPDLTMDSAVSAILAEVCRSRRENPAALVAADARRL